MAKQEKEYLYVGYYISTEKEFVLKIGTTCDLERRRKEHTRNYRKSPYHTMPPDEEFHYIWYIQLSKYNTLRYEDRNRQLWQEMGIGEFVRNDRFILSIVPNFVPVKIRKTYQIALAEGAIFCAFFLKKLLTTAARCGIIGRPTMVEYAGISALSRGLENFFCFSALKH